MIVLNYNMYIDHKKNEFDSEEEEEKSLHIDHQVKGFYG